MSSPDTKPSIKPARATWADTGKQRPSPIKERVGQGFHSSSESDAGKTERGLRR